MMFDDYRTIPEVYNTEKYDWSSDYFVNVRRIPLTVTHSNIGIITATADLMPYYDWLENSCGAKFPDDTTHWMLRTVRTDGDDTAIVRFYFQKREVMTHFALRWI